MIRKIEQATIQDFEYKLSFETWGLDFGSNDINIMYNSLLNSFLRIFYSSFPLKKFSTRISTPGISDSCKYKRDLYLIYRSSNDEAFKSYYRQYCKILKIKGSKKEAL
jgi:hypothetical protein